MVFLPILSYIGSYEVFYDPYESLKILSSRPSCCCTVEHLMLYLVSLVYPGLLHFEAKVPFIPPLSLTQVGFMGTFYTVIGACSCIETFYIVAGAPIAV
jgi:hypothetical protein